MFEGKIVIYGCVWRVSVCKVQSGWCKSCEVGICKEMNKNGKS